MQGGAEPQERGAVYAVWLARRDALVEGLRRYGHRRALALESPDRLAALIAGETRPGDLVVCLGAGDITNWAYALPGQLEALEGEPAAAAVS